MFICGCVQGHSCHGKLHQYFFPLITRNKDTGAFSLQSSTALDYTRPRHRCFQSTVKYSTGLYTTKTQVLLSTALESKEKSSKKMLHVTWRQCSCTQALHSAKKRWGDRLRQFVIPHTLSSAFSPKLSMDGWRSTSTLPVVYNEALVPYLRKMVIQTFVSLCQRQGGSHLALQQNRTLLMLLVEELRTQSQCTSGTEDAVTMRVKN